MSDPWSNQATESEGPAGETGCSETRGRALWGKKGALRLEPVRSPREALWCRGR